MKPTTLSSNPTAAFPVIHKFVSWQGKNLGQCFRDGTGCLRGFVKVSGPKNAKSHRKLPDSRVVGTCFLRCMRKDLVNRLFGKRTRQIPFNEIWLGLKLRWLLRWGLINLNKLHDIKLKPCSTFFPSALLLSMLHLYASVRLWRHVRY